METRVLILFLCRGIGTSVFLHCFVVCYEIKKKLKLVESRFSCEMFLIMWRNRICMNNFFSSNQYRIIIDDFNTIYPLHELYEIRLDLDAACFFQMLFESWASPSTSSIDRHHWDKTWAKIMCLLSHHTFVDLMMNSNDLVCVNAVMRSRFCVGGKQEQCSTLWVPLEVSSIQ